LKSLDRLVIVLFGVWLACWLVLSWPAVQDDALIHLRYADYLWQRHFITYDGIHPSYGTSSLLFVGLLAALRSFTASAELSRAVSTFFHVLLFAGVASYALFALRKTRSWLRLLWLALLLLLAVPSAVRWLDDGMETGLVLCFVGVVAWQTHRLSLRDPGVAGCVVSAALGFALVLLRTELASVALLASLTLWLARTGSGAKWGGLFRSSHFTVGAVCAAILIRLWLHSFLPDTALAKSHGIAAFGSSLQAAATVLTGAMLFGLGLCALWLLTAAFALRQRDARMLPTLAANALFPLVLLASCLRGQEIQGARYLVWCFFFSIAWNLLELARSDEESVTATWATYVVAAFVVLCLIVLPVESKLMYRVLRTRVHTMQQFRSEDLASALYGQLGVASDVGYISYFSDDAICDLAGLVNGRAAAQLTPLQREQGCAAEHPGFALVNASQAGALAEYLDLKTWRVCGAYDFGNLRVPDRHFLLVKPELAKAACHATGFAAAPSATAMVESVYP
jgi:hypothetical protein